MFSVVRNQIICIDDLERRNANLSVPDILGLASYLNENRACRIVILLNDGKLGESQEDFRAYFEKSVSSSYRYDPQPAYLAGIAIPENDELATLLRKFSADLGIQNIRIVRRAAKIAREAVKIAKPTHPKVLEDIAKGAIILGWSHFRGEGAPSMDYLEKFYTQEFDLGDEGKSPFSEWQSMLELYGWGALDDLDREILAGLRHGSFDTEKLRRAVSTKDGIHRATERAGLLKDAWRIYRSSFDDDAENLISALVTAVEVNYEDIPVSELDTVLTTLRELGRPELADRAAELFVERKGADYGSFDLRHQQGYSPIKDERLVELYARRYEELKPTRTIDMVIDRLVERDSWTDEILSFLANAPVVDYERVFRTRRGEELEYAIRACLKFQTITNASEEMRAIVASARLALANIGKDSPLNASRIRRFGVSI